VVIGVPREIKRHEYRVGLTPDACRQYAGHGHRVLVEAGAGLGAGHPDSDYVQAGAIIVATPGEVFAASDLVVKVKEPQALEIPLLRRGQILFTYLHLAADPGLARALAASGVSAVAYETIERADGSLPCLVPMSQIAGRLAVQEGAKYLEKEYGGRGILLAGVPGVAPGRVLVLGAGVAGQNACRIALGMGAQVTVLDVDDRKLNALDELCRGRLTTLHSTDAVIGDCLALADLVIGAVLVPGASAPKLIRRHHLAAMKPGAVIVDIAIDQGGCAETSRPTTHDDPVYAVDGVVHYCVANMPGAVALTSTLALNNATLPWGLRLADQGLDGALAASPELRKGLNLHDGAVCHPVVALSCGLPCRPWAG
jgi:alanine dehydrogenase